MTKNFFISSALPITAAMVAGADVQTPVLLGALRVNTKFLCNVYLVDGVNGYDVESGIGTLEVSIGLPGQAGTPPFYSNTFIANSASGHQGWQGYIDLTFDNGFSLMTDATKPVDAVLEFNLVDGNGARTPISTQAITIMPAVAGGTPVPPDGSTPDAPHEFTGSITLGNGVSGGTISALDLPSTPTGVKYLTVGTPDGGLTLTANLVLGSLTTDGFQFVLSGITNMEGFTLTYAISY